MVVTEHRAVMPQTVITDEMIAMMAAKAGSVLRIDCVYEGFDGPSPSSFAGRTVTDRFRNTYVNQRDQVVMPGHAVIALPSRDAGASPAAQRARNQP